MDYIRIQANEISAIIQLTGAELTYFSAKEGVNLMWNVNDVFWNRCAPILFPIVGKLKNDKYGTVPVPVRNLRYH
jgi:galactose mutarotase-like enzyme